MIDEAVGKILGMAMAYGVSTLGLFLAYANYRKRILKADKIMTGRAWGVVGLVLLSIVGGVVVVSQLAKAPPAASSEVPETASAVDSRASDASASAAVEPVPAATGSEPREQWPLLGILLPASIFLIATWITAALHRHFSQVGDG